MEQLLAHLIGDYVLQSYWMAKHKTTKLWVATIHAGAYTLPFLFLSRNPLSLFIIFASHAILDRYPGIVLFLSRLKNLHFKGNGYPEEVSAGLASVLIIVFDNTIHLLVNYLALKL